MSTSEFQESQSRELKDNSHQEPATQKATISKHPTDDHQYNESDEESQSDSDNDYKKSRKRKRYIKDDSDDSTDCDDIPSKKRIKLNNTQETKTDDNSSDSTHVLSLEQNNIKSALKHIQTSVDCTCKTMKLNECNLLGSQSGPPTKNCNDDWKLNPKYLKHAIEIINKRLYMRQILLPNIDCFSSHQNCQSFKWYITQNDDFFSNQYNCTLFWSYIIGWTNPSFDFNTFKRVIETYKRREIRGYLCGPLYVDEKKEKMNKWYYNARKECVYETKLDTYGDSDAYFPPTKGNKSGLGECPFDSVILYYDFRAKKRKKYEKGDIMMVESGGDGKQPVIVLSYKYDINDKERIYPSEYELLWLTYIVDKRKGDCWVSMESYEKIESYISVEELCNFNEAIEEVGGWKFIKNHRPEIYNQFFDQFGQKIKIQKEHQYLY
eukprot:501679_1